MSARKQVAFNGVPVPAGWHLMKFGTKIKRSDKYTYHGSSHFVNLSPWSDCPGTKLTECQVGAYIRKDTK